MAFMSPCGGRACRVPSGERDPSESTTASKQVLITSNANTSNQFEKVLHQLRYQVEAPIVFGQELQLAPKQVELLSARLIQYDWKAAVVPCAPTKEGVRAGEMIAVPSRMGITYPPELLQWGASPKEVARETLRGLRHDVP